MARSQNRNKGQASRMAQEGRYYKYREVGRPGQNQIEHGGSTQVSNKNEEENENTQ